MRVDQSRLIYNQEEQIIKIYNQNKLVYDYQPAIFYTLDSTLWKFKLHFGISGSDLKNIQKIHFMTIVDFIAHSEKYYLISNFNKNAKLNNEGTISYLIAYNKILEIKELLIVTDGEGILLQNDLSNFFAYFDGDEVDFNNIVRAPNTPVNIKRMFYDCRNLSKINLASLNITQLTGSLEDSFYQCEKLTNQLSWFNNLSTSTITGIKRAFYECSSLTDLNLNNLNLNSVTDFTQAFTNCRSLINFSNNHFISDIILNSSKASSLRLTETFYNVDLSGTNLNFSNTGVPLFDYWWIEETFTGASLGNVILGDIDTTDPNITSRQKSFLDNLFKNAKIKNLTIRNCLFGNDEIQTGENIFIYRKVIDNARMDNLYVNSVNFDKITFFNGGYFVNWKVNNIISLDNISTTNASYKTMRNIDSVLAKMFNETTSTLELKNMIFPDVYLFWSERESTNLTGRDLYNLETIKLKNTNLSQIFLAEEISKITFQTGDERVHYLTSLVTEYIYHPIKNIYIDNEDLNTSLFITVVANSINNLQVQNAVVECINNESYVYTIKEKYPEGEYVHGYQLDSDYNNMDTSAFQNFKFLSSSFVGGDFVLNSPKQIYIDDITFTDNLSIYEISHVVTEDSPLQITNTNLTSLSTIKYIAIHIRGLANFNSLPIENLNPLNTYYGLSFSGCEDLTSLDLSNFNTSNASWMENMFAGCKSLTSLDVSPLDTSNAGHMNSMFLNCESLTSLDLSNFDTSNVEDMNSMFKNCESLTSLDVSSFDTSKVQDITSMFENCKSLISLDVSNFNTSKVTSIGSTFKDCESLTVLNLSNFDTSNVIYMGTTFQNCKSLINLNLNYFNTSKVENMTHMFENCESLISLNINNFNTSKVEEMKSMFENCKSLTSLNVSSFNLSKALWIDKMFYHCESLTSLDVSNFNINYLIRQQEGISDYSTYHEVSKRFVKPQQPGQPLDIFSKTFDLYNCANLSYMFAGCKNLQNLNMFSIKIPSDMDKCFIYMPGMFANCEKLVNLNLLDFHFQAVLTCEDENSSVVAKGFDLEDAFLNCEKLQQIIVNDPDPLSITENCYNSTTDVFSVFKYTDLFKNAPLLTGGNGTQNTAEGLSVFYMQPDIDENQVGLLTYQEASA